MLLGMAILPAARAADLDLASLQREVAALRHTVQHLQAQVDRLESRPIPAEQSASNTPQALSHAAPKAALPATPIAALPPGADPLAASPQAQLRANWLTIERGINADEVGRLLGEPTKKLRLDRRDVWYYRYPALGNGSVFFTDAGRVSSRQSPF